MMVERAVPRDEYREVLSRLDILEHDVADVKAGITNLHRTMDERFNGSPLERCSGAVNDCLRDALALRPGCGCCEVTDRQWTSSRVCPEPSG